MKEVNVCGICFLKEIKIRLEINNAFVKMGKKKLYRLPNGPERVYLDIVTYV